MGNAATKESRQSSPSFGTTVLLSSTSRTRADRGNGQNPDQRESHSLQGHSSSREATGRRKSRKSEHNGYKMIIDPNETVDGGYLFPQGVYHGSQDFKVSVVREMIIKRRLAPFYKGLDAVDPNWSDEELLSAVNSEPQADVAKTSTTNSDSGPASLSTPASPSAMPPMSPVGPAGPAGPASPKRSPKRSSKHSNSEGPGPPTKTQQIWLYRNVHECPICFLVYPRLNTTRCCGQDICTECFVQIKRNAPHPPYTSIENSEATDVLDLISEPSCCPYCAQPDLGVIFEAPPFEWGIPSSASHSNAQQLSPGRSSPGIASTPQKALTSQRPRRTSVPASHPSVVTVDMIRPDWEEKLASARRRLARKSAAARALHRSALISNEEDQRAADSSRSRNRAVPESQLRMASNRSRRNSSLADIVEASRTMSAAQTRALERQMIEEAIQASLQ